MVVKVKRKSINSSGVWEVDETTAKDTKLTPKPGKVKSITTPKPGKEQGKQGISPKPENQNTRSPKKSEIQQPETSSEKTNQSFSPLKRQGKRIDDESTPAKQTKESEPKKRMEFNRTFTPYTNANTFCTWTAGELLNLVVKVEENCQHLLEETYSSAVQKVDWPKVSFGKRTPKECEEMWDKLFKKARTNRELVEEIREYLVGKELVTIGKPDDSGEKSDESKSQEAVTASAENSEENVKSEDDGDDDNEEEEKGASEEEEEEGGDDDVEEEEEEEEEQEEEESDE